MGMWTNRQINRYLKEFDEIRKEWIDILVKNPGNSSAANMIIQINAKMEVYRLEWNWSDESEKMAVIR